ncbi:MAG: hypothetical protein K2K53_12370, partial [Oscillospiraceae bacterium]|nr:hypothetical protein [Oscillospiraceae bacterium]
FCIQDKDKEAEAIDAFTGVRALVADDDMDSCQSVSQMLRQYGFRAEWTMYGKEAVVAILQKYGVSGMSAIAEKDRAAFLADLEGLGEGGA